MAADAGGGGWVGGIYTTENVTVSAGTGYSVTIGAGGDGRCNPGGDGSLQHEDLL